MLHPMRTSRLADTLNKVLDRITRAGSLLVLPLALLLCAQWPLRDAVGALSRQANDCAQWLFALYVALAVRHATRAHGHMAADTLARRYTGATRARIERFGQWCVLPWALFVLASGWAPTWQSLRGLEAFPDTSDPLYFIIKLSAWLLALLMALQALADVWPDRADSR